MAMQDVKQEIIKRIERMDATQQKLVLDFVEQLQHPQGISGAEALLIAKEIAFDSESLREMQKAIEDMS